MLGVVLMVCKENSKSNKEGVHLTLPTHIFYIQVNSGAPYITGQWGQVQNEIKES